MTIRQLYIFVGTVVLPALWSSFVRYTYSCLQMGYKIGALKNFAKSTEKHLCQSLFCKTDSDTDVFLWILWNFLRTLFIWNTSGRYFCRYFFSHCSVTYLQIFLKINLWLLHYELHYYFVSFCLAFLFCLVKLPRTSHLGLNGHLY